MHPREMLVPQYLVPEVLSLLRHVGAGTAFGRQRHSPRARDGDRGLGGRTGFLEEAGFAQRVLVGLSGGGPLAAFYVQAKLPPDERLARSPAGRPTGLDKTRMPVPQGVILLSAHMGQGPLLLKCIDPSVTDENDPMSIDEALSPFNAANGFKRPPESANYSADFVEAYRAAQWRRIERIESHARRIVEVRGEARKRSKEKPSRADAIITAHTPIFNVAHRRRFALLRPQPRSLGARYGSRGRTRSSQLWQRRFRPRLYGR